MIVDTLATRALPVADESQIGEARRLAGAYARAIGCDATEVGRIEIVASELATNLWLHARGGELLVRTSRVGNGIELLAVDRGPGMANPEACLRDGFSTAGTAGNGLGAVRRLSQHFDLYSQPGKGTVVLAQCLRSGLGPREPFVVGAVSTAVAGEDACGDAWSSTAMGRVARLTLADGLGHGPDAALAAGAAIRAIAGSAGSPPPMALECAHRAIAGTRGAAVAICDVDAEAGLVRFAGVGNVAGAIVLGSDLRSMVSHNGIVGHQLRRAHAFTYPWHPAALLIMHSDGLQSRWSLDPYPGLPHHHPAVIAAVLHRDFQRGRDDATVVVLREAR